MKNLFNLFTFVYLGVGCLVAQEKNGYGFLNIVNLLPGNTPADIVLGGKELMPGGIKSGDFTGWFMMLTGTTKITIDLHEQKSEMQISKLSDHFEVIEGLSNVLVLYLQPDPRIKPDGTPYPARIRFKEFPAYKSKGFGLRFLSTCATDQRFQIGPLHLDAKPLQSIEIGKWSGRDFQIAQNGKIIGKLQGAPEPGSFYLFVGAGDAEKFTAVIVRANPQSAPPWMQKKLPTNH